MINFTDLFGREGMAGIVCYLIAAHIAAGTLAPRHIDKHLVAQCQAGYVSPNSGSHFKSTGDQLLDAAADALKSHGGQGGQVIGNLLQLKAIMARSNAAQNAAAGASSCACRLKLALQKSDVRLAWTAYVASWKLLDDAPAMTLTAAATIDGDTLCRRGTP